MTDMSEKDLHSLHEMVAAMQDELRDSDVDDFAWCSWRVLKSVPVADGEDKIELLVCPTKRKSETDGHLYYSVESVIDYAGDALGEATWSDTEDCGDASLLDVLQTLVGENTDEEIRALYRKHVLAGMAIPA